MPDSGPVPFLSLVIPVKNEEATIPALAAEIDVAFTGVDYPWEALWIDDGSNDRTLEILKALPKPHRWISFDRNHGQSAAFAAGFRHARGEWIGTVDGDGQNDPADLRKQLAYALERRVDMVNGIRAQRADNLVRKISSKIGNGTRNWLTGRSVSDVGCSTRVAKRECVLELPFFHGNHRFLPTLVAMRGYTIAEIPVNHRQRAGGRSKYGINNRLWSGLRDCFGVRWLAHRNRSWKVAQSGGSQG
ncbi:MAG: glycosyltransferase family 2 protein [Planctomycetes bacterium]|nr:glycosyltransferase family 2 protein [Planctomycetota bacterium]